MSKLAQIGAFIGRVFSYEILAALAAKEVEAFDDELEELTRTELVFRRGTPPDATYTFKHALVQDAAYNSVPIRKRPRMHARIADLLETQPPEAGAATSCWVSPTEAGTPSRRFAVAAGRRIRIRPGALQEAVNYLEKGLGIIERLPPSAERDHLELSLREPLHSARLRWRGWAASEVGANAMAILWLAQRQRQPQSLLIGLWGMWINTITQGRIAESPAWARRLLVEGTEGGDVAMQIFGYRALLSSHFYLGELHQALDQKKRILELYDRPGQRWMELTGNDTRTAVGVFGSQSRWMLGYPDEAAEFSDEKDADARKLGHPFDIGWALTWGAYVFDYRGEPDRLLARAGEADRLGREQSIPVLTSVLVPMVSDWHGSEGELPEAISSWGRIDG